MKSIYKRVLVKLSGEALGDEDSILVKEKLDEVISTISILVQDGVEVALVVGGGNIWRGKLAKTLGLDKEKADYMGMTATLINAKAIESLLVDKGIGAITTSAFKISENVGTLYEPNEARKYLSQGKVVILGAGTGKPFCSTDKACAQKASDIKADVILKAYYTVYASSSVLIRSNELFNNSNEPISLNKFATVALDLPSNKYKFLSVHGTYATDRLLEENEIKHNTLLIEDNANGKGYYHNPMGILKRLDNKEFIGVSLLYSGNFTFSISGTQMDSLRFVGGINEEGFTYLLNTGESFETPEALLVYEQDEDAITLSLHDFTREHILRKAPKGFEKTILLNSWEGTYFDFNTDKILSYLDKAKEMGMSLFVLDDGWFGKRNTDTCSLGDWKVNTDKIDLKKVIDHAHALGLKFGLWVEPEMISYDSDIYRAHPEYALFDHSIEPTLGRHQLVMDLTNPEVRDYIFNSLKDIFDNYDIDYCKWDFNRILTEAVSPYLSKEHQGETYHRFVLGSYDILNRFATRYPNVLLEGCAGGGGRYDLGMLKYVSQIWASDEVDAISRTYIQYSTNKFYPLCTIGSHVSMRRYLTIKEKAAVAMFGTFGYEFNPNKLTKEDLEDIKFCNKQFLDNKEVIHKGDYYSLINPFDNENFISWEVVSKDKKDAVVFIMNYHLINWRSRFLKLKGLEEDSYYHNDFDNGTYSGAHYMSIGINVCSGRDNFTPSIIILKKVNGK